MQYHITFSNFLGDDHEIVNCYVEPRCTGNALEQEENTGTYFLTIYMHSCTVISIIVDPEFATGLLNLGVNALLSNDAFKLSSVSARQVLKTAIDLSKWMQFHQNESVVFESNLIKNFQQCLPGGHQW